MSLDPDAQSFLNLLTNAKVQPLSSMAPAEARTFIMSRLGATGQDPPPVAMVQNISIELDEKIPVRLYRGQGTTADQLLPAVVFFHGGGFVLGNLDSHDALCRQIANAAGCAVASVDYRLAPEHKYPAAVEDAEAATKWLFEHAKQYKMNPQCFVLAGDSAGGTLAAVVALMSRGWKHKVCGQVLIYPCTDLSCGSESYKSVGTGYAMTADSMNWFIGHYLNKPDDSKEWQASPLKASNLKGAPPAWIMTAGYDPLRDEGAEYARRLEADGVEVNYRPFSGQMHGFVTAGKLIKTSDTAVAEIGAAIRTFHDRCKASQ